jgi:hypothetical protein
VIAALPPLPPVLHQRLCLGLPLHVRSLGRPSARTSRPKRSRPLPATRVVGGGPFHTHHPAINPDGLSNAAEDLKPDACAEREAQWTVLAMK